MSTVSQEQYVQPGMRLGLKPTDEDRQRRLIRFSEVATGEVPHPLVADNMARVSTWGLYQNNKYGDCGPVSVANLYRLVSAYLGGGQFDFSDEEVFDLYRRSGNPNFNPQTGADDNGVDMTVMLSALVGAGIGIGERNRKPVAFASVDAANIEEMRAAVAIFGGVLWGSELQQAQEGQFTGHQAWDYVSTSPDWGGHATMTGRYSDDPNDRLDRMTTVTWGTPTECTNSFLRHSVQECYVVVWPENLGTQQFQEGVNLDALARYFEDLTGKQLPRDAAPPAPAPTPAPSGSGPTQADDQLWAGMKTFLTAENTWRGSRKSAGDNQRLQDAQKTFVAQETAWARSKGYVK